MYNLAIRKCASPPLLAPRLQIFKLKFISPPEIEPRTDEPEADMLPSEPARRARMVTLMMMKWIQVEVSFGGFNSNNALAKMYVTKIHENYL